MKKLFAFLLLVGALSISGFSSQAAGNNPFDPARFSVPTNVAGHKVLAVISADNTMCTPPHDLTLIVRVGVPDPQSYPSSDEAQDLNAAMDEFSHPGWTWSLMTIGPSVNLDNMQANVEQWNKAEKISGCEPLGRPLEIQENAP